MDENKIQKIRSLAVKIENMFLFLEQKPPKYILAYHKCLGVDQKMQEEDLFCLLKTEDRFLVKRISSLLLNGRYDEATSETKKLRKLVFSYLQEQLNENNKDRRMAEVNPQKSYGSE